MKHLGEHLAALPLPRADVDLPLVPVETALVHDLGADLPAGHLHVWGGPRGAGKTAFFLNLLHGAAARGRRVVYATYHLPAESLALRLLAMVTGYAPDALAEGRLPREALARAAQARAALVRLPFFLLEARGLSAASLEDRLVRMPYRAEVLAVDYLQAVIRPSGTDPGSALKALSALAARLHVAVIVALQAQERGLGDLGARVDRQGWLGPVAGGGERRAEVLENRHGGRPVIPLRLDPTTGALCRLPSPEPPPEARRWADDAC